MSDTDTVTSTTSLVDILSSAHGRKRRSKRLSNIRDLQAAVKYGKKEVAWETNKGVVIRWKHTFKGVVFITDDTSTREITTWPEPGFGYDVPLVDITQTMERHHRAAKRALHDNSTWTSHTVVVVDQSGSMRNTDMEGGATRSDGVWISLALTWVQDGIKSGARCSTDVMSVVVMINDIRVLIDAAPMDWHLFNRLITLLRTTKPSEGGVYLEAIDIAEKCLMRNTTGSCALALLFFSDGSPSDHYEIFPFTKEQWTLHDESKKRQVSKKRDAHFAARDHVLTTRIGAFFSFLLSPDCLPIQNTDFYFQKQVDLASRFGRRLTEGYVGFADSKEDFCTLHAMTEACASYQCQASFHKPKLDAKSLDSILTGLSSTLTTTRTEMTALGGSKQRTVRDVQRESKFYDDDQKTITEDDEDWWLFDMEIGLKDRLLWTGRREKNGITTFTKQELHTKDSRWSHLPMFIHPSAVGVAMRG